MSESDQRMEWTGECGKLIASFPGHFQIVAAVLCQSTSLMVYSTRRPAVIEMLSVCMLNSTQFNHPLKGYQFSCDYTVSCLCWSCTWHSYKCYVEILGSGESLRQLRVQYLHLTRSCSGTEETIYWCYSGILRLWHDHQQPTIQYWFVCTLLLNHFSSLLLQT